MEIWTGIDPVWIMYLGLFVKYYLIIYLDFDQPKPTSNQIQRLIKD